jgi:hypothetical protein
MRPTARELYTVILDYNGGTYASQVMGSDQEHALREWIELLESEQLAGPCSSEVATAFRSAADPLVALEGLRSTWCGSAVAKDGLALANLVKTAA